MEKNKKVRAEVKRAGLKMWQVADLLGISPNTLCIRLRHELSEEEQKRIVELIRDNSEGGR